MHPREGRPGRLLRWFVRARTWPSLSLPPEPRAATGPTQAAVRATRGAPVAVAVAVAVGVPGPGGRQAGLDSKATAFVKNV